MGNGLEVARLDPELKSRIERFADWAQSLVIQTIDERERAINELKGWKGYRSRIVAFFNEGADGKPGIKPSAYATWKTICDAESAALKAGDQAEKAGKEAILVFDREQEVKRLAEQRRLQAIADEQARKEREKLEVRAEKAEEKGKDEKAEALREQAAEIVAPVVQVAAAIPKVEGITTRKIWKARVINMNALVEAAQDQNSVARSFLVFNEKVANSFAASTKGTIFIPGICFEPEDSLAIRNER